MATLRYAEELFLRANSLIDKGNLNEGKELLEEIIEVEPAYGRAYNHLGWLYFNEFQDSEKGERLYKLALKFAPEYPAIYLNYIYLLVSQNRIREAEEILEAAKKIADFGVAKVLFFEGLLLEAEGKYKRSVKKYKLAAEKSLDNAFIAHVNEAADRARKKSGVNILFGIRL